MEYQNGWIRFFVSTPLHRPDEQENSYTLKSRDGWWIRRD